jgi:putative transposase
VRGWQLSGGTQDRRLHPLHESSGNCYDNATTESFWSTLQLAETQSSLFDFIEVFYNRQRRHSALGDIPPALFKSKNN